jgi:hydroxymethylpyrimidine pyrophosphatase-like HAD family hydrolase
MSRLEEIKTKVNNTDEPMLYVPYADINWLISRVEEFEYASKYNGDLNEFLQKRKLPPNTLGRHVVDVVMDYVEELENLNKLADDTIQIAKQENSRYKQALEFYADKKNYRTVLETKEEITFLEKSKIQKERGEKSRRALKGESE